MPIGVYIYIYPPTYKRGSLWLTELGGGELIKKKVHADASNFASDLTKEEVYDLVLLQAKGLVADQRNWVRRENLRCPKA